MSERAPQFLTGFDVPEVIGCSAKFSADRRYRYALWRRWDDRQQVAFIMLNPSTADEMISDPTITRCIGYAKSWGFGSLIVGNLFAYRSTDPKELYTADDPIGPENDECLARMATGSQLVIAAWGVHGAYRNRGDKVRKTFVGLRVLGLSKGGHPLHPLYLRADLKPVEWSSGQREEVP